MTLDELMKIFHEAQHEFTYTAPGIGGDRIDRAGVTAIVRALRDETRHMTLNRDSLEELFTQILGDAGEKVAEYTGGMNDLSVTPATDPAPAVCVWTKHAEKRWSIQCTPHGFFNPTPKRLAAERCAMCKAPIKFTEAK